MVLRQYVVTNVHQCQLRYMSIFSTVSRIQKAGSQSILIWHNYLQRTKLASFLINQMNILIHNFSNATKFAQLLPKHSKQTLWQTTTLKTIHRKTWIKQIYTSRAFWQFKRKVTFLIINQKVKHTVVSKVTIELILKHINTFQSLK